MASNSNDPFQKLANSGYATNFSKNSEGPALSASTAASIPGSTATVESKGVALTLKGEEILFPQLPYNINKRANSATVDDQLQKFVNHATLSKDVARRQVLPEAFGDRVDAVRSLGGEIKQHTLDNLDHYMDMFVENARKAGAHVHFAADSKQANAITIDIAKRNNVKLCVKSKSMVTEETHLLPALEGIGCETIETDLGEFILQLDNDAPSHIVTPMIHKDRTAVGRAFTRELGAKYTEDAGELTRIARNYLRSKYREAGMGMSGANFLVAETGSLVLCTNEGNGRLCTTVPKVHVAFVGIEKLVPRLEDLAVLLKLLARSSTGQPLTVYTHTVTGPKRATESDGPEEVHIIFVDNGRTEVLKKETREMLRCIRCGACLNACPVYRKIGGHSYGAVYSGPIGALITPIFKGLGNFKDLPQASSLCGACYEACPVKINIPKYLIQLRRDMVTANLMPPHERKVYGLWALSLKSLATYRLGGWGQKFAFRLAGYFTGSMPHKKKDRYADRGWLHDMPGPIKNWTDQRDMPTPPTHSFRHWWRQNKK